MHIHEFADHCTFSEVSIGGTLAATEEYQTLLKKLHPKQMLNARLLIPLYRVEYSYETKRGNFRKGKKYYFSLNGEHKDVDMATPGMRAEFLEMYEYLKKIERYIQRKITIVPSVISFDQGFHQKYLTGKRAGCIYGYPLTIGAWCNDRLKLKAINRHYNNYGDYMRYLGLAADEPERLKRLKPNCKAPLAEWGMTEKDCIAYL